MKNRFIPVFFFLSLLLTSCSTNRLITSWTESPNNCNKLSRLLVIGLAQDETKRRVYEDTFTRGLTNRDITAIPLHGISNDMVMPDKQRLQKAIQNVQADSVFFVHHVSENEEKHLHSRKEPESQQDHYSHNLFSYYTHTLQLLRKPYSNGRKPLIVLEANLYNVDTETLLWSSRSQSFDPVMTRKYYQQIAELLLSDLQKKCFFKKNEEL